MGKDVTVLGGLSRASLVTTEPQWPHQTAKNAGKCIFILISHVPRYKGSGKRADQQ